MEVCAKIDHDLDGYWNLEVFGKLIINTIELYDAQEPDIFFLEGLTKEITLITTGIL